MTDNNTEIEIDTESDTDIHLSYGQPADAVGEPDMRFGRLNEGYVLVPEQTLNWGMIEENEVAPGEVDLSELSPNARELLFKKLESTDLDELATRIQHGTELTDQEARIVVLFSGLEYDREEIAAALDTSEAAVDECILSIEDRYDREQVVADLQAHTELSEREAEVFTLAEAFDYEVEEIAAELDISETAVAEHFRTIGEEYDLDDALEEYVHESRS